MNKISNKIKFFSVIVISLVVAIAMANKWLVPSVKKFQSVWYSEPNDSLSELQLQLTAYQKQLASRKNSVIGSSKLNVQSQLLNAFSDFGKTHQISLTKVSPVHEVENGQYTEMYQIATIQTDYLSGLELLAYIQQLEIDCKLQAVSCFIKNNTKSQQDEFYITVYYQSILKSI